MWNIVTINMSSVVIFIMETRSRRYEPLEGELVIIARSIATPNAYALLLSGHLRLRSCVWNCRWNTTAFDTLLVFNTGQ